MPIPLLPLVIGGTALSTIGKFIGNRQAAKVAERNTNLTIAENKKQAELAYNRELSNIQEMNKYNSPISQMERFKAAKLNPALIYSQGTAGQQTQLAKYNAPRLEYNYLPKFRGDELDSIKNLPLSYVQAKNLMEIGNLNKAKSVIENALSGYAKELAKQKVNTGFYSEGMKAFEYVFKTEELQRFFDYDKDLNQYFLRPEAAETFLQALVTKWTKPTIELGKTQQDVQIKEQLLKNLKVIPWLQPIIQFLKLFN